MLDVLSVMQTLQLAPEAVNKWGGKAGFEVGVGLFSPMANSTGLPSLQVGPFQVDHFRLAISGWAISG